MNGFKGCLIGVVLTLLVVGLAGSYVAKQLIQNPLYEKYVWTKIPLGEGWEILVDVQGTPIKFRVDPWREKSSIGRSDFEKTGLMSTSGLTLAVDSKERSLVRDLEVGDSTIMGQDLLWDLAEIVMIECKGKKLWLHHDRSED